LYIVGDIDPFLQIFAITTSALERKDLETSLSVLSGPDIERQASVKHAALAASKPIP
jgi:hypothetical protein